MTSRTWQVTGMDACGMRWPLSSYSLGGYTAGGIPLVRSANGNGNGNGIPFNGIPFPFVSVRKIFESSVSVRFR